MSDAANTVNSVEGISSSLNTLNETLKQMEKNLSSAGENFKYQETTVQNITKKNKELTKIYERQDGIIKSMAKKTREIFEILISYRLVNAVNNFVVSSFKIQKDMLNLGVRMGKGREEGERLYKVFSNIQRATGRSTEEVDAMVTTLAKGKFQGDLENMSTHMLMFSRVTGVSAAESGQLALNLSRVGGMADKDIKQLSTNMAAVQQRVGITEEGMSALADQIQVSAFNMAAMGKSAEDIKRMGNNTTALVAAFEKVGIAARETLNIVESLTDPERIEDNIALYSQLGISIQEAMSGGDITDQISSGMKEMAARAEQMGPIAGAQYAKAFGVSYKTLMKANQADVEGEMGKTAEESMVEMQEKMLTGLERIEMSFNKLQGILRQFSPMMLVVGAVLLAGIIAAFKKIPNLFKRVFGQASVETQKDLEKAVVAGTDMGAKKSADILRERMGKSVENIKKSFSEAMESGGARYAVGMQRAQNLRNQSSQGLAPGRAVGGMAANMVEHLSKGNSLLDLFGKTTESLIRREVERVKYKEEERAIQKEIIEGQKQAVTEAQNALGVDIKALQAKKEAGTLSDAGYSRLKSLEKESSILSQQLHILEGQEQKIGGIKTLQDDLSKMSAAAKEEYRQQLEVEIQSTDTLVKKLEKEVEEAGKKNELDKKIVANLEIQKSKIEKNILSNKTNGTAVTEEAKQLTEINRQMEEYQKSLNKSISDNTQITNELNKQRDLLKKQKQLKEDTDTITQNNSAGGRGGVTNNISRTISTIGSNITAGFKNGVGLIGKTLSSFGASIKATAKAAAANPLKALGSIFKMVGGPMLIIGIAMKFLAPILQNVGKHMNELFKVLNEVIGPVIGSLMKGIMGAILSILKLLYPVFTRLAWLNGILIKALGEILKVIGNIPFIGGPIKALGEGLSSAGDGLMNLVKTEDKVIKALDNTSKNIQQSDLHRQEEAEAAGAGGSDSGGAPVYRADGTGFTRDVTNQGGAAARSEMAQKEITREKRETTMANNSESSASFLSQISDGINELVESVKTLIGVNIKGTADTLSSLDKVSSSSGGHGPGATLDMGMI